MSEPRIHVLQTGRLTGNKTFMRGESFSAILRRRESFEFPAFSFIVEQADGLLAIDTGLTARARSPRPLVQRRWVPNPTPTQEIGPAMRAAGLRPEDVRRVVLTHLDWDHAGGLGHFPQAEVLIHRPEFEFASTFLGRRRYEPELWPADLSPALYDLDPEPYGPFPTSKAITEDIRLVPLPGHSIGQVGVIVHAGDVRLLFTADHMLRQDWYLEDLAAGRLVGLGTFYRDRAVETSRRIHRLLEEAPTVLLPSHDAETPARLAALRQAGPAARRPSSAPVAHGM